MEGRGLMLTGDSNGVRTDSCATAAVMLTSIDGIAVRMTNPHSFVPYSFVHCEHTVIEVLRNTSRGNSK
jgi:hypothetical protein